MGLEPLAGGDVKKIFLCSVNKLPGKTEAGKMLDLQGNLLKVRACFLD